MKTSISDLLAVIIGLPVLAMMFSGPLIALGIVGFLIFRAGGQSDSDALLSVLYSFGFAVLILIVPHITAILKRAFRRFSVNNSIAARR